MITIEAEMAGTVNEVGTLVEHLRLAVENHRRLYIGTSREGFVLEQGRSFTPQPYRPEDWGFKGVPKRCFANSYALVRQHPDKLRYAEGYCLLEKFPHQILHAWAIDSQDRVVDPTLASGVQDYYGVVFDTGYVRWITRDGSRGVALIDNHADDFPLLTGEHTHWMPRDTQGF